MKLGGATMALGKGGGWRRRVWHWGLAERAADVALLVGLLPRGLSQRSLGLPSLTPV